MNCLEILPNHYSGVGESMGTGEMLRPEGAGSRAVARNSWLWLITGLVFAFAGAMLLPWVLQNLDPDREAGRREAASAVVGTGGAAGLAKSVLSQPAILSLRTPLLSSQTTGKAYEIPADGRVEGYESQPIGLSLTMPPRLYTPLLSGIDPSSLSPVSNSPTSSEGDTGSTPKDASGEVEPLPVSPSRDQAALAEGEDTITSSWVLPRPAVAPVFGAILPAAAYSPLPAQEVRGVHASSNQAGSSRMTSIVKTMSKVGLNAVVVEIKDEYGRLAYQSQVPLARQIGAGTNRIADVRAFLEDLHERGFYVIARLVTFQDGVLAEARPQLAITRRDGGLWRNRQNLAWADPGRAEVWRYEVDIAEEALHLGFDEVQFDYVRFPTDGDVSNIRSVVPAERRVAVIAGFLAYARQRLAPYGRPVSADVFGFVATARDDLGIGQILEDVAASVDFVSPMVYPSHYPKGSYGFDDPDAEPYGVIRHAMAVAVERIGAAKLRPWLQSFSLGHTYGPAEIAAQIRAVSESGISGWLFWNASGRYDLLEAGVPGAW